MARSLNRVQLIGNLTRDPELRYTPSGAAVCSFGLATNRSWNTDTGEKREETEFHQVVAWNKLAEPGKANQIFNRLVEYGQAHIDDAIKIDYFAVSLPNLLVFDDDLDLRNQVHCLYMMSLGYFGLNKYGEATACLEKVLAKDKMHFGARSHLGLIKQLKHSNSVVSK